jgi:hypothetical protein
MGRKNEMFGHLFSRRDKGKLPLLFTEMGVSLWTCRFFRRFGQWTATNPFTPQSSMENVWFLLGVQTGNKRTTREWTRPGNRPTISFWFGEFINGRVAAGLHALFDIIIKLLFELSNGLELWKNWFSGLTNLRILIFFYMNVFFSRKKNERNMNIIEHGSKELCTFVREFIIVYFLNLWAI